MSAPAGPHAPSGDVPQPNGRTTERQPPVPPEPPPAHREAPAKCAARVDREAPADRKPPAEQEAPADREAPAECAARVARAAPAEDGADGSERETHDPHCLPAAAADRLLRDAPWRRFAVLGDGMVDGRGDRAPGYRDVGWPDRVAAALAHARGGLAGFTYCNVAEHGRRTAEVRATQLGPVLAFRPDLVLVVTGVDDVIRRDFERCDDLLADYDAIVTALQAAGAEVVTATIFDVTRSPRVPESRKAPLRRRLDHLASRVRLVAQARRTVHLDLAGHPAEREPDVYGADIRFATRRGHAIAAAALVHRLGEHLGNQLGGLGDHLGGTTG
jgi:hypothetical protein